MNLANLHDVVLRVSSMVKKGFDKLGVLIEGKDIQACNCLKDNDRAILRFSSKKIQSLDSFCQERPQIFRPD